MLDGAYVQIFGRLGSDVELRATKQGKTYGILSIAVNKGTKGFTKKEAPKDSTTKWYKSIVWNEQLLVNLEPFLKSGKKVLVIGELDIIQASQEDVKYPIIKVREKYGGIRVLEELKLPEDQLVAEEGEGIVPTELDLENDSIIAKEINY